MSATTNLSPILVPAAPVGGTWRGRLAGWLARLATTRRQTPDDTLPTDLSTHLSRDMGLPPGPSHDDGLWGVGGLLSR
jgi:hypothetical protein